MVKWFCGFLAAVSFFFLIGCLNHTAFQGGQLTKGPFFSYPRYVAQLQELDLNKNGQYSTTFSGFPASPAWLEIDLIGRTGKDHESIAAFKSQVSMELNATDGNQVCKASGQLNQIEGVGDHHWVLTYSVDSAGFWNSDCLELKIRRNQSYTLKITVAGASEALGPLRAQPLVLGGGHEPCC